MKPAVRIKTVDIETSVRNVLAFLLEPFRVELFDSGSDFDLVIAPDSARVKSGPSVVLHPKNSPQLMSDMSNEGTVLQAHLAMDMLLSVSNTLSLIMHPKIALSYRLSTGLPFQYNWIPTGVRSRLLKIQSLDYSLANHLSIDIARKTVVEAIGALGISLGRRVAPSLVITHDIDSEKGLARSRLLKSVEDDIGIKSIWFITSHEYRIGREAAKDLTSNSIIGSHDMRHDGKLIRIEGFDKLVGRLSRSREALEEIFGTKVSCFRSPLLQFNENIITAEAAAGYTADFSLPTWEPVHPTVMKGFGVESTQCFQLGKVMEVPLTLLQDHQVLYVLGMNTRQAVDYWMGEARIINSFDGHLVLSIHPDYAFSENLRDYRSLLLSLVEAQSHREDKHNPNLFEILREARR